MYAFVRFFEDDMCYALPVSNVEDFRPLHKTDFDNQKVYLVHRTEENGSAGQPCEAQILALAGKLPSLTHQLFLFFNVVFLCLITLMCAKRVKVSKQVLLSDLSRRRDQLESDTDSHNNVLGCG